MVSASDHQFSQIYDKHSDQIYSYIFLLVNDRATAEDLTQETFIKAFQCINQFNQESQLYTWLIKIARNTAIDYLRKKTKFTFLSIEQNHVHPDQQSPVEILIKDEKITILYEAIRKLRLSYREVIVLRKIKEFSIKETASILNWNENKVRITTLRALKALKKELKKRGESFEEVFSNR
ncbi:RNA polymerase sigma factor [Cytobacillus purgationiresistens]|uniref:RNA polymerase sigma factor n=1 Tax=Cytobacillus purgationiresistens TaxID=863449 RepID=A0ABU0AJB1_9BACI|nr:sigma-70 family RNA polymerase sigma factor [Cytobacillus purgationiresistens]MDQ0270832.1 RNA polymerase sigma-70 factor (ECF subfamily) [Cytobacillus purgationiresistens]